MHGIAYVSLEWNINDKSRGNNGDYWYEATNWLPFRHSSANDCIIFREMSISVYPLNSTRIPNVDVIARIRYNTNSNANIMVSGGIKQLPGHTTDHVCIIPRDLTAIGLSHKSQNTPVPYPGMHHFVTEMCTCVHISVTKWCIVGYFSDALWDLWNGYTVAQETITQRTI